MNLMILSTNRADWGHMTLIMGAMKQHWPRNVFICAAAGHFDRQRGYTADELKHAQYPPDFAIRLPFEWKSSSGLSKYLISFQKRLRNLIKANNVSHIMVLGDRIELLPVINLSIIENTGIIHISGGETTRGAVDDKIRNMLSINAQLVFTGGRYFSNQLLKMGIDGKRIVNAGDPALELIAKTDIPQLQELNDCFGLKLRENDYILMTYHPETNTGLDVKKQMEGIEEFLQKTSVHVLCTAPNGDRGGDYILKAIKHACKKNSNVHFIPHLGSTFYLSAVKHAALIAGNSSSIIIEAPFMKKHTLLIGERQDGRPLHSSIMQSDHKYSSIESAIKTIMESKCKWKNVHLLYEQKNTAEIVTNTVKERLPDFSP